MLLVKQDFFQEFRFNIFSIKQRVLGLLVISRDLKFNDQERLRLGDKDEKIFFFKLNVVNIDVFTWGRLVSR